mmetsp:Transcript_9020/g.13973  ORF Transcript_9020/g.13973 Transcript_9020/m.13973 type:complete len:574 (+) Transcript_9020:90-1811(+)
MEKVALLGGAVVRILLIFLAASTQCILVNGIKYENRAALGIQQQQQQQTFGLIQLVSHNSLECHDGICETRTITTMRGGSIQEEDDEDDDEDEEEEEEDDDEEEEDDDDDEKKDNVATIDSSESDGEVMMELIIKRTLSLYKAMLSKLSSMLGADSAAASGENKEEFEIVSLFEQLIEKAKTFLQQFLTMNDSPLQTSAIKKKARARSISSQANMRDILSTTYGVPPLSSSSSSSEHNETTTKSNIVNIVGGSLSDALQLARSKARLLIVVIPAYVPETPSDPTTNDAAVVGGLLSEEMNALMEQPALKKNKEYGSFFVWSALPSSAEAEVATKRLSSALSKQQQKSKTKKKKTKSPLLLVCYPATKSGSSSSNQAMIVPKVIAQHHADPPPSSMKSWLVTIRKQHLKHYAKMQHETKELQLLRERQAGYESSIKDYKEQQRKEKEKQKLERLEKERLEARKKERQALKESLPQEPEAGDNNDDVVTISLRFADGSRGQRRFRNNVLLSTVFDWVDACFEMERECVVLTTMNGKETYKYPNQEDDDDAKTLVQAGFGKMVALRVSKEDAKASQ